ncbi:MAG: ABC transporter ATP-binding protein [Candidatus Sericytochromatia bacterium]|nr:MAG: ABC transporter ATP-binding protein [Candidatus Sericytochromatia bacterium]
MIKVKNLTKSFNDFIAVNNISFEVNKGSIYGLLGPNGAGKTTTLRMIAGLLKPSSGDIEICNFNRDTNLNDLKRNIGFLTGSTSLYGRLTPIEILNYFGTLNFMPKNLLKERIDFIIDKFKLHDFKNKWCEKLSTGQKQRVSIARTILHDPPVLIFDEPTSGLDIMSSEIILEFIKEEKKNGKAIIFSTHNMSEAGYLCDKLGLVYKSHLIAQGTIEELKSITKKATLREVFLDLIEKSEINFRNTQIFNS